MIREKIAQALMMYSTKKILKLLRRSALCVEANDEIPADCGTSRLGGVPLVPADFQWPYYAGESAEDDTVKSRPLAFLAQFRCDELHAATPGNPLPAKGMLAFFYEVESQPWGFSPADAGCARVYWFEDTDALSPAEYPEDLPEEYHLPACGVNLSEKISYPAWEDLSTLQPRLQWELYEEVVERMEIEEEPYTKLLGWPDIVQNNMTEECEWVSQGYYVGGENPPEGLQCPPKAESVQGMAQRMMDARRSVQNWRLLWQLDSETAEELGLIFGDCGTLYFYIREEDLQARRFENVWLILQCG